MKPHVRAAIVVGLLSTASSVMADELSWISVFPGGSEEILREEGEMRKGMFAAISNEIRGIKMGEFLAALNCARETMLRKQTDFEH